MIIRAFATHLQSFKDDIPPVILLSRWLKKKLESEPQDNVDRVIHHEIELAKNNFGMFVLVGKSASGRKLMESLYNFALSYEQQRFSRWVHDAKPKDFDKK